MSLTAAFNIARTALSASSLGIQVTGNNLANVATPGYSRQVGRLVPLGSNSSVAGQSIGRGVQMRDVRRQVDDALQARLWNSTADLAAANQHASVLSQLETVLGELGDHDLSSELSAFFGVWSERANQSQSSSVVVQQGQRLASFMGRLRGDLLDQRSQLDAELGSVISRANQLASSIADINRSISEAELGGATANTLRDQRDEAVTELSQLMNVTVIDRGIQGTDVLIGSQPLVLGGQSRGLQVERRTVDGSSDVFVSLVDNSERVDVTSGKIGAILNGRGAHLTSVITKLDQLAAQTAFEINKLHSTGRNLQGLTTTTAHLAITPTDQSLAINDPNNQTFADLPFRAQSGGFLVQVRQTSSGATQSVRVNVDLDGVTSAGLPGNDDDTTPEQIRAALDAVDGIRATFTPEGRLKIEAETGYDFSFADDSSNVLAVLGVNSYFTGTDAASLQVRADLVADPTKVVTGRMSNGQFVENGTVLAIAQLQDRPLASLSNQSISASWRDAVQAIGVVTSAAQVDAHAAGVIRDSIDAQRAAMSGVSVDEEAINLSNYQRAYQGAARLVQVTDELTQTLMSLI